MGNKELKNKYKELNDNLMEKFEAFQEASKELRKFKDFYIKDGYLPARVHKAVVYICDIEDPLTNQQLKTEIEDAFPDNFLYLRVAGISSVDTIWHEDDDPDKCSIEDFEKYFEKDEKST